MSIRFGAFSLDRHGYVLSKGGDPVPLEPQVFSLLSYLLENRDHVVGKDELIEHVWEKRLVSDAAITTAINLVRRAVNDDGKSQAIIRTFPRRGFRFMASVDEDAVEPDPPASKTSLAKPSIAIMPFENLSNDPEQEYFSDGICEDIITALSNIRQLFVIARHSTIHYKGASPDMRQVASDLGVRYILEGSIRKSGDQVRITAQLIEGESGNHLWAKRYDHELKDMFAVQDEITTTVVGAIQPELSLAEQHRSRRKMSDNLDAWDFYQRGIWHCWRTEVENFAQAKVQFQRAIELDPDFCLAHAYLAFTLWRSVVFQLAEAPAETLDDALAAAKKAVAIDNSNAHAHWAMGAVYMQKRDLDLAQEELQWAIDLSPSLSFAHHFLGWTMVYNKQPEQGILKVREAQRLSPNDPSAWGLILILAQAHMNMKEFANAEKYARQAKRVADNLPINIVLLAILGQSGKTVDAKRLVEEMLQDHPHITAQLISKIYPFRHQDDLDIWIEGLCKAGLPEA